MLLALGGVNVSYAGTLQLGPPIVEDTRYVFPVELLNAGGAVAALDFRIESDPSIFLPLDVLPGPVALQASKMISANAAAPGQYVVVVMGLNQASMGDGEVARVILERIGGEEGGGTVVALTEPTLATPDGSELPVSGSQRSVSFGDAEGEGAGDVEGLDDAEGEAPPDVPSPAPTSPAGGGASPTGGLPRGGPAPEGSMATAETGTVEANAERGTVAGNVAPGIVPGAAGLMPGTVSPDTAVENLPSTGEVIENNPRPGRRSATAGTLETRPGEALAGLDSRTVESKQSVNAPLETPALDTSMAEPSEKRFLALALVLGIAMLLAVGVTVRRSFTR